MQVVHSVSFSPHVPQVKKQGWHILLIAMSPGGHFSTHSLPRRLKPSSHDRQNDVFPYAQFEQCESHLTQTGSHIVQFGSTSVQFELSSVQFNLQSVQFESNSVQFDSNSVQFGSHAVQFSSILNMPYPHSGMH